MLYVVHDIMQRVLGADYKTTIGRSQNELSRFTQTANNVARHDPTRFKPHAKPMGHIEAVRFIRDNVVAWLARQP